MGLPGVVTSLAMKNNRWDRHPYSPPNEMKKVVMAIKNKSEEKLFDVGDLLEYTGYTNGYYGNLFIVLDYYRWLPGKYMAFSAYNITRDRFWTYIDDQRSYTKIL